MGYMFNVGDRVVSEKFGEGTVINNESKLWSDYPIEVRFNEHSCIEYFDRDGYYDWDRKVFSMIKLIQTNQKVEADMHETEQQLRNRTTQMLHRLSDSDRKFKIKYLDIEQYINRDDLKEKDIKVKVITGRIENFNNQGEVVINGDDGFYIIQYRQILQMEEIVGK